jgi:hypothetical protein
MLNRRGLIGGLLAFAAAPAIVRAENIMPIKPLRDKGYLILADSDFFIDPTIPDKSLKFQNAHSDRWEWSTNWHFQNSYVENEKFISEYYKCHKDGSILIRREFDA